MSSFIAICAPVDWERCRSPLPGSTTQSCFDCGRYVVLSPSSIKRKPKWVVCHDCETSLLAMQPGVNWVGFSRHRLLVFVISDRAIKEVAVQQQNDSTRTETNDANAQLHKEKDDRVRR